MPTMIRLSRCAQLALLLSSFTNADSPSPAPPPAPPCTVAMLKQRTAGDKNWPIACSHATLGDAGEELDLSGAHLSYGDFEEATFQAEGAIRLNGTGLEHAKPRGSKITATNLGAGTDATINFNGANLAYADLSGSKITATGGEGDATIGFYGANLDHADLSGSKLAASDQVLESITLPPPSPSFPSRTSLRSVT